MKIVYNKWIPFKGFKCINLFGVLFVRDRLTMSRMDLNHEAIHTAQMKEWVYEDKEKFTVSFMVQAVNSVIDGVKAKYQNKIDELPSNVM